MPGPSLRDPGRIPLLVAVVSLVTVVAFEALAISTVMPIVEDDLGEIQLYGWVFSAFYMGTLIGVVLGGNAVDRMKPVRPMMIGVGVFLAGLVVGGLAPSMEILVAGRFVQGLGAGVVPAVSYVVVARGFPEALHPKVFAAMSAAWVLPALISPLLASVIGRHFGWRWVLLGLVPVTIVVAAVAAPAVRRVDDRSASTRSGEPQSPLDADQLLRVLALTVGATAAIVGLGLDELVVGIPVSIAGLFVMVPTFRSLTPPGTLAARPRLPVAILIRGLLTFAFFASDAFLALGVTSVRHRTTIYAGFAMVGSSVSWSIGSWIQSRYFDRAGGHQPVSSGLVRTGGSLIVVGALGLVASLSQNVPIAMWVLASMAMGLGMGLAYTTISVVTLAEAESGREGAAASALQLSDILGIALGTGIAGVMVALGARFADSNAGALVAVFGSSAVVAVLVVALAPRLSREPSGASVPG